MDMYLCAETIECNGTYDGRGGGVCKFTPKAKDTPCSPKKIDACLTTNVANKLVCDGTSSECPQDTNPDPVLHVKEATVIISPPTDPKKLYTRTAGGYVLHTTKSVSVKVAGVHASLQDAAQSPECKQYTLLWYLGRNPNRIIQSNVAHGETKSMVFSATSPTELLDGSDYVVCVRARNDVRDHVTTQLKCSSKIRIDRSPPSTGTIGFYADATCKQALSFLTFSPDTVHACWVNFKDEQSSVNTFAITLSEIRNKHATAVKTVTVSGNDHTAVISEVVLREGGQFRLSVVAADYVNGQASSQSKLVTVDRSPPQKGDVQFRVDGLVRLFFRMTWDGLRVFVCDKPDT